MKKEHKKTDRIMIFTVIALVLLSSFSVTAEYELGEFWSKINNTVVLTNITNNVNIGENATTEFTLNVKGTINSTTLNTGQGNYELYAMNQDVETTSDVEFENVTTTKVTMTNSTYTWNMYVNATGVLVWEMD